MTSLQNDQEILVSITENGELLWGEMMSLPENEMIQALESAGLDTDVSEMMTYDEYVQSGRDISMLK